MSSGSSSASARISPVVRLADLALAGHSHGERFAAHMASISGPSGAGRLGARYVEVPPGKRAWPFHAHHANDEMFVILGGCGRLRFGAEEYHVAAGDVVMCPAGGAETAHQLCAGGEEPLRYLAISSMHEPDVLEYPDSGKVAVFAGSAPGGDKAARQMEATFRARDKVDYWDRED
ncbi:MAG: cupin domain-containing protein [Xanthobacter sp.]